MGESVPGCRPLLGEAGGGPPRAGEKDIGWGGKGFTRGKKGSWEALGGEEGGGGSGGSSSSTGR